MLTNRKQKRSRVRLGLIEALEDRRLMAVLENFDAVTAPALPASWAQTATQSNTWRTVANTSDTAPNHAFVANLDVVSESILTSPSFVLSATTPILQFRNNYATEQGFDGGVLEIAINGGAFSDILAAGGSFIAGGYVGSLSTSGNPIAGRAAWHGTSSGYITTTLNLPASAFNQNVQLRWRFGTDESVSVTGWRIDTISLESIPTDDFGDAPTTYPVTLAENGARHTGGALRMGATIDLENDGVHSAGADYDGSDEDGVVFTGSFVIGAPKTISVTASQAGLLNAWIDWNADGDWADTGEQVFTNQALVAGANSLTVNVPTGLNAGNSFARFRLSSAAGLGFTGAAADGEVEDYSLSISMPGNWSPLGPFSATNGQVEGMTNRPVVGAIHTVLAHPTNADILYVGSTNGGVWRTTNATNAQPNWTPLTDSMPSQSIGALVFDLADATSNTIWAGVGRYSSFAQIGNTRTGLMRSIDGGLTWQTVDGGGLLRGKNISGIYANGSTIVVSVNVADSFTFGNIGIFRSTNGGASFTQISSGNGAATGLPGGVCYDLVYDPINPSTLYTSTVFADIVGGLNGVYKSTNSGATWTRVSSAAMNALITNSTSNLEMATGRNNEVYAAIINGGAMAGLFRSPNNGTTWVQMDSPKTNENGTDVGLNPSGGKGPQTGTPEAIAGGQGNIHFSIVADPTNANIVYVGGDRQPRSNGDTGGFPNSIGAQDFSGRLFRGDASRPTGSQFVHLTHRNDVAALPGGGTASNSSPHADSREMTFDAAGNLLEVDDGGVYRRTSPRTNTGDWFSVIGNLQGTEAHDVAWDSLSNVAMTGNQDTGTTYQPNEGATTWVSISTGDGGDVAVDNIERAANNQSVRYTSFQNLGSLRRTIWNAAGVLQSTTFPSLSPLGGAPAITGAFRTPVETNNVAGGRLLILGSNGLYESLNGGTSVSRIGTVGVNDITINSLSYGGTQNNVANPDVVWAGIGTDVYVRTAGSGNVALVPSDPTTSSIRDLTVNSRDWSNAFVIDDNQVFQTTNTGASWSDVTGGSFPAGTQFWSLAFVAGPLSSALMLGTNIGVFMMSMMQVGNWTPIGNALPTVLAYDMEYDATDDLLVVGTLGRGAWSLSNVSSYIRVPATVVTTGIFYNGSGFESVGGVSGALDTGKAMLRSSSTTQTTTFTNVSNYTRGINGAVLDVSGLASTALTAADFFLRVAPAGASGVVNPSTWASAPTPSAIVVTPSSGSTPARVQLEWTDNLIENTWLQIVVRANANTGLTTPAVFYLGHAQAEVNGVGPYRVSVADVSPVQTAISTALVGVNELRDFNKDRRVTVADLSFVQGRVSTVVNLNNITIPIAGSVEEGSQASNSAIPQSGPPLIDTPAPSIQSWLANTLSTNSLRESIEEASLPATMGPPNAATKIGTQLVAPETAPTPSTSAAVDRSVWFSALTTNDSTRLSSRRLRLVDDFFANWSAKEAL